MTACPCCGSNQFGFSPVLWPDLIREWRLADYEAAYVDRQQGYRCKACHCSLRAMNLAKAIIACLNFRGLLRDLVKARQFRSLKVLEVNDAGELNHFLRLLPGHVLAQYPEVDMTALPYANDSFDLIVHSDTLEHVLGPIAGLGECRRTLKPGAFCCFTIPIIVDRFTVSREGLPPSYHGTSSEKKNDYLVHTEYGCDAWKQIIQAGFEECRIFSAEYPVALALVGVKARGVA